MEKEIKIKYTLYARKSSEQEDKQLLSIDSQISELGFITKNHKLEIKETLSESHSAKKPGRPIFNQMIAKIERGEANGLLVWNPNRLSRNSVDTGTLIYLMDLGKLLEIRTPSQTFRHDNPSDKFLLSLLCSQAKLENDNKGVDVKRGLRKKASLGMFPGPAPTGYINDKYAEHGLKQIKPDPERFELIRKLFVLMLTGNYTVMEVLRIANDDLGYRGPKGRKLGRSTLYNIFTKPVYYGEFEYPFGSGNWYKGKYTPIITLEEFDKIQIMLGGKGKPRPKKHIFSFTGMMHCGECGAMITAEQKVKRQQNGNIHTYIYYHCTKRKKPNCSQGSVEEKKLIEQIQETLDTLQIPPEFHDFAMKWFRTRNEEQSRSTGAILTSQRKTYDKVVRQMHNLIDMRAAEDISDEEFSQRRPVLMKEKIRLEELLSDTHNKTDEWLETADEMLTFVETAKKILENGAIPARKQILSSLSSNLVLQDRKLRIDLQNALFPMQSVSKEARVTYERLEPLKNRLNKEETERAYARNPRLLRD